MAETEAAGAPALGEEGAELAVVIGATVPTGFELTAAEEVQEKLGSAARISRDRGKIYFEVPARGLPQVRPRSPALLPGPGSRGCSGLAGVAVQGPAPASAPRWVKAFHPPCAAEQAGKRPRGCPAVRAVRFVRGQGQPQAGSPGQRGGGWPRPLPAQPSPHLYKGGKVPYA